LAHSIYAKLDGIIKLDDSEASTLIHNEQLNQVQRITRECKETLKLVGEMTDASIISNSYDIPAAIQENITRLTNAYCLLI
jgi:hypothetical protein